MLALKDSYLLSEDFMQANWISKTEIDLTVKLNDLCNTNCAHCFSHGEEKDYLKIFEYHHEFLILFKELYKKNIRTFSIAFVGGEITLIPEKKLTETIISFYKIVDEIINWAPEKVKFDLSIISNFLFGSKKPHLNTLKHLIKPFNKFCEIKIITSYEIGLNRFKNDNIESLWRKNCIEFAKQTPLYLLVTLNKQTCDNIENIVNDKFFNFFEDISFNPMLNFADKYEFMPDYEKLYKTIHFLKNFSEQHPPFILTETGKPAYSIVLNNDGVISCGSSEEVKIYDKKTHFNLLNIKENLDIFKDMLENQMKKRIKATRNKNCLGCEHYSSCDFGFEFFDPSIKCPAFKITPENIFN